MPAWDVYCLVSICALWWLQSGSAILEPPRKHINQPPSEFFKFEDTLSSSTQAHFRIDSEIDFGVEGQVPLEITLYTHKALDVLFGETNGKKSGLKNLFHHDGVLQTIEKISKEKSILRFLIPSPKEGSKTLQLVHCSHEKEDYILFSQKLSSIVAYAKKTSVTWTGYPVRFEAFLQEKEEKLKNISGFIEFRTPRGERRSTVMHLKQDSFILSGEFIPEEEGDYELSIFVSGTSKSSLRISRTISQLISVEKRNISLSRSSPILLENSDDETEYVVKIPLKCSSTRSSFIGYAEIYDNITPLVSTYSISDMERSKEECYFRLFVHKNWIPPSYQSLWAKLVRITSRESGILLDSEHHIPIQDQRVIRYHSEKHPEPITLEMRRGKPPKKQIANTQDKLVLVHGYCSPDNPFPTEDFSNFRVFLDPLQSINNDLFALRISNQTADLFGCSIIAHSQGGLASLHLLSFYWSCLDYLLLRNSSRLIQSVGTPWHGTLLAGNLAWLAAFLGHACGSNYDLTYEGAEGRLKSYPNWAREQIYYYTTSFQNNRWSYDYCLLATDPFLKDPDDGIIEKWSGELKEGNYVNHKEGQCHAPRMRDPPHCEDKERNTEMNKAVPFYHSKEQGSQIGVI